MKSPEFMPLSEELQEEKDRLNKGDPKSDKKGRPLKEFVGAEQIIDKDIDIEEEIAEKIDHKKEEESENEIFSKEELLKKEIINDLKNKEKIGFLQRSKYIASVGPDSYDENTEENIEEKLIPELVVDKQENQPFFLSGSNILRKLFKYGSGPRKSMIDRNTGREKDNLKTRSDSKIQKDSRKIIGEILNNPDNFSQN